MQTDPRYDNCFDAQLAALDQVRAVQRRLLPVSQRERLDNVVRCFVGMQLADEIDAIAAVGFDQWIQRGMKQHVDRLTAHTDHGEAAVLESLRREGIL